MKPLKRTNDDRNPFIDDSADEVGAEYDDEDDDGEDGNDDKGSKSENRADHDEEDENEEESQEESRETSMADYALTYVFLIAYADSIQTDWCCSIVDDLNLSKDGLLSQLDVDPVLLPMYRSLPAVR